MWENVNTDCFLLSGNLILTRMNFAKWLDWDSPAKHPPLFQEDSESTQDPVHCVFICLAFQVKTLVRLNFSPLASIPRRRWVNSRCRLHVLIEPSISSADIGQQKIECKLLPITCICIQLLRLTKKFPKTPHPSTGGQDIPSPKCSKSWATIINERWVLNVYLHSPHMLFNAWRSEIQSVRWALDWREGQKK